METANDTQVLNDFQRNILRSNKWLDDTLIDLGQRMLQQQFQYIDGFQSVVLAEKFALIPQLGEFIQVLNVANNHWIMISTVGCPPSTIDVYDSFHGTLSSRSKRLVADILHDKSQSFTIRYQDAQWQSNGCDCGLFALANATSLCYSTNPCKVTYDQSKMREHFLQCIEEGKMAPFPIRGQSRVRRFRSENVDIYCVCRLPDADDTVHLMSRMVPYRVCEGHKSPPTKPRPCMVMLFIIIHDCKVGIHL